MGAIGENFRFLTSVDSTNNYAMAQVHAGIAKHGDTYFAYEQTAGKGQRNKNWITAPGENVIMSTVLHPEGLLVSDQFMLSMAVAVSCFDLLKQYLTDNIAIKWPNDLYWNDRKAGGILIENSLQGNQWHVAIAGIGINVNQTVFPEQLKNPVSLKQILGRSLDVVALAHELCNNLNWRFTQLTEGHTDLLIADYNKALYKLGETVRLRRRSMVFSATIKGVSGQGMLVAETGMEELFEVGEVEWVM